MFPDTAKCVHLTECLRVLLHAYVHACMGSWCLMVVGLDRRSCVCVWGSDSMTACSCGVLSLSVFGSVHSCMFGSNSVSVLCVSRHVIV